MSSSSKRKQPEEAGEPAELEARANAIRDEQQAAAKRRRPFNFSIESLMHSVGRQEQPGAATNHELTGSGPSTPVGSPGSPADSLAGAERPFSSLSSCSSAGGSSMASVRPEVECASAAGSNALDEASPSQSVCVPPIIRSGDRISRVECVLDNKEMWDKFHSLNTEMIITKTGRRMFPVMKVQFHNLDPDARYAVSMDIVPVDNKRYRYAYHKSCWQVAGKADPSAESRLYPHPDSPFKGDILSRQVISFEKVKLTNNEMDKSGHIILNSMHKYQPRVHLIEVKSPATSNQHGASKTLDPQSNNNNNNYYNQHQSRSATQFNNNGNQNRQRQQAQHQQQQQQQAPVEIEGYRTFVFPETVFTAVTAYQNQLITKMKIDKNPFAKGFRDSSRLSDLDRNDPFDYMGSLGPSSRFVAGPSGQPGGLAGSLEAAAAAAGAHMDAYQLLASAANNPWYSAAVAAAAAGGAAAPNPFNPIAPGGPAGACNSVAHIQATQMWLAAFSACLNGGGAPGPSVPGPSSQSAACHRDTPAGSPPTS